MFDVVSTRLDTQFVNALLGELHDEHVYCNTRHCIVLCLHICIVPAHREFLVLAIAQGKLAWVRKWL